MNHPGRFEPRRRARRRALQALYQWQLTGHEASDIIAQFLEEQDFQQVDVSMFEQLVRGVIRDHEEIDQQLSPLLDRPPAQLDHMERVILRMGAWELVHLPEVPFRVVLDEAIDLARRFGAEGGHRYVNGVLDLAAAHWRPGEVADSKA